MSTLVVIVGQWLCGNVNDFRFLSFDFSKNNDFQNASLYYSYALRLDPFNNLIIYEYVDLLVRNNKVKQALKLLKNKISAVESKNIEKLLRQKYEEIKSGYKTTIWDKLLSLFQKK